jgi:hypothetical protein
MNEEKLKLKIKRKIQDRIIQESRLANVGRVVGASLLGAASGAAVSAGAAALLGSNKVSVGMSAARGALAGAALSAKNQYDKNKTHAEHYRVKDLKKMIERGIKELQKIRNSNDSDKDERMKNKTEQIRKWTAEMQEIISRNNK